MVFCAHLWEMELRNHNIITEGGGDLEKITQRKTFFLRIL